MIFLNDYKKGLLVLLLGQGGKLTKSLIPDVNPWGSDSNVVLGCTISQDVL